MFQKKILFIVLIFLFSSCAHKGGSFFSGDDSSESGDSLNLKVKKVTLDNGLRILIVENHQLPIFSYYTFFDVGGRYESRGTTGATHFLEHLMFKGAKKYGPGKFDTLIEGNGGRTNAYTSFDSTVYYESLPIKSLETIIDLESDRMVNLLLVPKTFESERNVVLEERKLNYENSPRGKLYQTMMKAVFEGTPYGGSVIGEAEDVKNIKREEVFNFFKKFYAPNNAIVVISGDVDTSKTIDLFKKYYGGLLKSEDLESIKKPLDNPKLYSHRGRYKREIRVNGNAPIPSFMMAFKGEPLGSKNTFVLDILSSILGDGESSYLNQQFVNSKRPVLSGIGVSNYNLKHNGVFFISGQMLKGKSLRSAKRRLERNLLGYCDKAITERSLQKTKNQYLIGYYRELETNKGVAHFLGIRENFFNDYDYYKKELEIYKNIEVPEVIAKCKEMFKGNKSLFVSVWNKHPKKKRKK